MSSLEGKYEDGVKETLQVGPSDHSLLGEGGKVQGFAWQWWSRAAESCHRKFKGPPLFHFPPWTSACSNKNPMFVPVSFHCRSLTFIWIFVPVWGCWLLFLPHLTNEEREVCDIKWFAQVTRKVGDGVCERKSQFLIPVLRVSHQRKPCSVQGVLIQPCCLARTGSHGCLSVDMCSTSSQLRLTARAPFPVQTATLSEHRDYKQYLLARYWQMLWGDLTHWWRRHKPMKQNWRNLERLVYTWLWISG